MKLFIICSVNNKFLLVNIIIQYIILYESDSLDYIVKCDTKQINSLREKFKNISFTIEHLNLLNESMVIKFSNGSATTIYDFDDDDDQPVVMTNLHMDDRTEIGRYNLKIIPTYNADLSSNVYNVIIKLDYRKLIGYHRKQRNGQFSISWWLFSKIFGVKICV